MTVETSALILIAFLLTRISAQIIHPSNDQLWENHIAGASLLVQLREPQKFTSDFDKALITGLWYPIVSATPSPISSNPLPPT